MNDTVGMYFVYIIRKDRERFLSIVQNFKHTKEDLPSTPVSSSLQYGLKLHESELMILKLAISNIAIIHREYLHVEE